MGAACENRATRSQFDTACLPASVILTRATSIMTALRPASVIRNFLTSIVFAAGNEALSAAVCLNVAWFVVPEQLSIPARFLCAGTPTPAGVEMGAGAGATCGCGGSRTHEFKLCPCKRVPDPATCERVASFSAARVFGSLHRQDAFPQRGD
jgi:hypothetical protein